MKEENNTPVALFVGSFDPFTIGHADIVERTLKLFGRIIIGVGINPEKHCMLTPEERIEAIQSLYKGDKRVRVVGYADLAVDLARREGAAFIVKAVRSVRDFEYERDQADLNRRMAGVETLLLYADPALAAISSSAVRQLKFFKKDTAWMMPERKDKKEKSKAGKGGSVKGKGEKAKGRTSLEIKNNGLLGPKEHKK